MKYQQQILLLPPKKEKCFENFIIGSNLAVIEFLSKFLSNQHSENIIYLFGKEASGKTHLLHALIHQATEQNLTYFYMPIADFLQEISSALFASLEKINFIAIDDIEKIQASPEKEEIIFDFYNRAKEYNCKVIFTSQYSPKIIPLHLMDLKSRLTSCLSLELQEQTDENKINILVQEAKYQGLIIDEEVFAYLLKRHSREMPNLLTLLNKLNTLSLQERQKITIPFIKKWAEFLNLF